MPNSKYALIVGVGGDLPVTERDAVAINDVLVDPGRGGYEPGAVELLVQRQAHKDAIVNGLQSVIKSTRAEPSATAFIYFSGHGGSFIGVDGKQTYFLVPHGFDPGNPVASGITDVEFTQLLEQVHCRQLVVFLDCCHAGGMAQQKGHAQTFRRSSMPPALAKNVEEQGGGLVVVASSLDTEYSYVSATYSVFTECLLDALHGRGQPSRSRTPRVLDVLSYILEEVPQRAPGAQHPFVNKISNLSSNYSLLSDVTNLAEERLSSSADANSNPSASLLLMRKDSLVAAATIHQEKIRLLSEQAATTTDVLVRYESQKRQAAEEVALSTLRDQLDELESQLQRRMSR